MFARCFSGELTVSLYIVRASNPALLGAKLKRWYVLCCCSSLWQSLSDLLQLSLSDLPHHATGGGRRVGAVEHWSRHLWLLPHQCHGGEDPHAGKRPLHPPVCDRRPVCRPHPAHDLHTMAKTLKPHWPRPSSRYMLFCCRICRVTLFTFHPVGQCDNLDNVTAHGWRSDMFSNDQDVPDEVRSTDGDWTEQQSSIWTSPTCCL